MAIQLGQCRMARHQAENTFPAEIGIAKLLEYGLHKREVFLRIDRPSQPAQVRTVGPHFKDPENLRPAPDVERDVLTLSRVARVGMGST
jgi:hypothetical protein